MKNKNIEKVEFPFFCLKTLLSNITAVIMTASLVVATTTTLFIYHMIVYLKESLDITTLTALLAITALFLHFALTGFKGLSRGWFDN